MTTTTDTTAERRGGPSSSGRALAAALVCLVTVVAFETMSVATVMPKVRDDIGGLALYGWAFSGLALGEVVGIVIAGSWSDRANPVRPILVGLGVYSAGLIVSGVAGSMFVVVVGRVLQGYGSGTVPAVAYVCVGRGFSEEERPRVFAWMSTAWVVPSLVGPYLASQLTEHISWRAVFLGLIPIVVVIGALAVRPIARLGRPSTPGNDASPTPSQGVAVEAPARSPGRTAWLAAVAVVGAGVALGALQAVRLVVLVPLLVAGSVALLWAFLQITPPGTLRVRRGLPAAVAVRGMLTFSFLGADAFVALALHDVRGMSISQAGIVLSSSALTWTTGSWFSARRIGTIGPRRLVRFGFGFVVLGIVGMAAVVSTSVNPWFAIGAWLSAGLGVGMAYAPLTQAVISAAEPSQLGAATSALQLSDVLGFALGTGIGGAVIAIADRQGIEMSGSTVHAGVDLVFAATGVVGVLGLVSSLRLHRYLGGDEPPVAAATAAASAPGSSTSSA